MPGPLSEITVKKFKRMLRALDLEAQSDVEKATPSNAPTESPADGETVPPPPSDVQSTQEQWPQLMLLAMVYENPE